MKQLALIGACAVALFATSVMGEPRAVGSNERLTLRAGTAATFRSPAPVFRIVVGNPAIMDIVPQTDRTVALIAKVPGRTNFILLDESGNEIFVGDVAVSARETAGGVAVHGLGGSIFSHHQYNCSPICSYAGTITSTSVSPATGEETQATATYTITPPAPPNGAPAVTRPGDPKRQ